MEKVEIKKLIEQCLNYFYESGYAKGTIDYYKCLWTKGILQYMSDKGIDMYTPDVGAKFIESTQHQDMSNHECERIRSIHALNDIMTVGYIRKQCVRAAFYSLDGAIGKQMEKLVLHLISLRRGKNTLKHYRSCLGNFLYYLDMIGVQNIKQITEEHVIRFLSSQQLNREKTLSIIRCLFLFWRQENIIDGRFEEFFATYKLRKKERIPSYYTTEEIKVIENSVSRSSALGKRNYAMILLASRLGLRASDIMSLKFSDIDWDNDLIKLRIQKTGKTIELPLLADVGNAIIDYLRYGRPASTSQNIFLSSRAPYIAATQSMVCGNINKIIRLSGVNIDKKRHGPHSLRHSLASNMLENGATMPIISEVLGHRNTETTMTYLKINLVALRKCVLPVPPIPDSFYTQKGGAFYG